MTSDSIKHILLTFLSLNIFQWCLHGVAGFSQLEAQENMAVTLSCPLSSLDYINRKWSRGTVDNENLPEPGATIFNQIQTGLVNSGGARDDMSLNKETFQMTINRVRLTDDLNFTCSVFAKFNLSTSHHVVNLGVFIQPDLQMTGLSHTTFRQNAKLKVICKLDRLYPELEPGMFQMNWGDREVPIKKIRNRDGSFRYYGMFNKTLTREDNEKDVTCSVRPKRGKAMSIVKTLNVRYISAESPVILMDPSDAYRGDEVTFTCDRGDVKDNPAVTSIDWYKDGLPLADWPETQMSHTLVVKPEDSGEYSCRVGNTIGFSDVSLWVKLSVSNSSNPFYANVGVGVGVTLFIILLAVAGIILFLWWRRKKRNEAWKGKLRRPASKILREKAGRLQISSPVSVEITGNTLTAMEGLPSPTWVKSIPDLSRQRNRPKSMPCNPSLVVLKDGKPPVPGQSLMEALNLIAPPQGAEQHKDVTRLIQDENMYENVKRHSAVC